MHYRLQVRGMEAVDQGRAIISITKSLRAFSADDARIVRHFAGTRIAGKGGLFASSIRGYSAEGSALRSNKVEVLYNDAGLDLLTFERDIRPWLESQGLAYFLEDEGGQESIIATVLTYDALLRAVVRLFDNLEPAPEKARACLHLVHLASDIPTTERSARHRLASLYGEEAAILALDLVRGLRLALA